MEMNMVMSTAPAMLAAATMTSQNAAATPTTSLSNDTNGEVMSMGMSDMAMVFYNSQATPLFSRAWKPSSPGAYAGTCIFIFFLTITHHLLIALRTIFFEESAATATPKRVAALKERKTQTSPHAEDDETTSCLESGGTILGGFRSSFASAVDRPRSWMRTSTARATCDVAISGIGYLIMLAAMTMNVGYFLSVIAGIFFGTLLFGRFGTIDLSSCHH